MANKLIGAVILGVAIWLWAYARNQELYALHANAYLTFTLITIYLTKRGSA